MTPQSSGRKSCSLSSPHTGQQCRHVRCGLRSAESRRWGFQLGRGHLPIPTVTCRNSPSRTASPAPLGLGPLLGGTLRSRRWRVTPDDPPQRRRDSSEAGHFAPRVTSRVSFSGMRTKTGFSSSFRNLDFALESPGTLPGVTLQAPSQMEPTHRMCAVSPTSTKETAQDCLVSAD